MNHYPTRIFICQSVLVLNPSLDVYYFIFQLGFCHQVPTTWGDPSNKVCWGLWDMQSLILMGVPNEFDRSDEVHLSFVCISIFCILLVIWLYTNSQLQSIVDHMHIHTFDYNLCLLSIIMYLYPFTTSNNVRKVLSETKLYERFGCSIGTSFDCGIARPRVQMQYSEVSLCQPHWHAANSERVLVDRAFIV